MIKFTTCPMCGNKSVGRVRKDWRGNYMGNAYVVPGLTYSECSACKEKFFDRQALRRIESHRPKGSRKSA